MVSQAGQMWPTPDRGHSPQETRRDSPQETRRDRNLSIAGVASQAQLDRLL
ncbi:hypothetical protein OOK60_01165 [Trichothermofontia sichuanensis B231]|uniref:hypothetical protein n=1 Tax=Trichothermofontia sichuanensis TaxID=3045816 RepID=UPI002246CAD4|nr:hypothetical protein [Trichothermofontia sichuanensis]UZQ54721.1 hypothetical protein OOK60_01165 [Trichothermofontia sichuanensis B231]